MIKSNGKRKTAPAARRQRAGFTLLAAFIAISMLAGSACSFKTPAAFIPSSLRAEDNKAAAAAGGGAQPASAGKPAALPAAFGGLRGADGIPEADGDRAAVLLNASSQGIKSNPAPISLNGLAILAVNSSRAAINGELTDLVAGAPGLSSYLRGGRTFVPVDFITRSFGLSSSHNESKGALRLKKGADAVVTLDASEYDYSMGSDGEIILFVPLRKVTEAMGKTVAYYDGLIVVCDGAAPFDAARDAARLAELRASLTGAIPVGSAANYEKLLQSADTVYWGPYTYYMEELNYQKSIKRMPRAPSPGAIMEEAEAPEMNAMRDDGAANMGPAAGGSGFAAAEGAADARATAPQTTAAATTAASKPSPGNQPEAPAKEAAMAAAQDSDTAGDEFSKTNIQVEGVDESDVVKTDGKYIYQVNNSRILIVDAYPPSGMKLAGKVDFNAMDGNYFEPREMYVDADRLTVLGTSYRSYEAPKPAVRAKTSPGKDGVVQDFVDADPYYPYYNPTVPTTRVLVYDIKDKSSPKLIRESEIEGDYMTSRKIGGALYVVTNKPYFSPYYRGYYEGGVAFAIDENLAADMAAGVLTGPVASDTAIAAATTAAATTAAAATAAATTTAATTAVAPTTSATTASPASGGGGGGGGASSGGPVPNSGTVLNLSGVSYSDSATANGAFTDVDFSKIYYFPGCVSRNNLIVAGIDTRDVSKPINVESVLDYGNNVYVSHNYLYIATQNWRRVIYDDAGGGAATTTIHRFKLDGGAVAYDGKGEVNGTILNQFSMDQSDGFLRVATTSEMYDARRGYYTQNNLYILDGALKVAGRLEGLAPGEHIYSVRFIGARGYVVTFKTVDPLFVIDLADPYAPKVLGALKIPGYSDYLHPYDENHIIGFGKDTVEYASSWSPNETTAYYQGIKIALFDVSDVANPKEKFKTSIGDRGTDSELLRNHRALLFSKERELLAFPVTVMTVPENQKTGKLKVDSLAYGQFEFQGAYVYKLNLKDGFTLTGKITHISPDEYKSYGNNYWYDWYGDSNAVERLLYIKESLYALSKRFVTSCPISDPNRETGRLALN